MTLKRLSLLAFALSVCIARAQTQVSTKAAEEYFDEGKCILEARQKGIQDQDVQGYVNAARSRFMLEHHYHDPNAKQPLKRVITVNMNTGNMTQRIESSACQNLDLGLGNYSNWTGDISNVNASGTTYPINTYAGTGINGNNGTPVLSNTDPCGATTALNGRQVIMNMPILGVTTNPSLAFSNGYDPTCQNSTNNQFDLPVTPANGINSIRLGSAYANYTGEKLRYQVAVSNSNTLFTYQFAVVISNGFHSPGNQAAFTFQLTDQNGTPVGAACGQYGVDATQATTDTSYIQSVSNCFNIVPPTYYRKWHTVTVDLSNYIGQTIYANFETMDCTGSGHYCYAYISATCGNLSSSATVSGFCGTSGTAICQAPPGFASYQWYGPNNMNPIPGATNQVYAASGASLGDVFTVNCVTLQGCTTKLSLTVVRSNILATPSSSASCRAGSTGTASVTINGSTGFSYTWTPGGAHTAGITGVPPGCYTVHIVDNSGNCSPKDTSVCVQQLPAPVTTATAQLCGTQAVLTSPAGAPYTWYNNNNANTGVTSQSYTVTNGNNGNHYTVTYKDPSSGCLDSLQYTMNQLNISFTSQQTNPCNGGSNGSIVLSPAPGNNYSNFNWTVNGASPVNGTPNGGGPILYDSLMAGGTYTIAINAAGNPTCSYSLSVTLSPGVPPPPATETVKGCVMDNKSIPTFTTTGHSHKWYMNGSYQGNSYPFVTNGVTSGTIYVDTMRDYHGCVSIYKATLALEKFNASLSQTEVIHCHNDSTGKLKATANSEVNGPFGTPYTFAWHYPSPYPSPAVVNAGTGTPQASTISNLHAGTYTVIIRSGGCADTLTKVISNPAALDVDTMYAFYCPKDSLALLIAKELGHPKYTWLYNHTTPVSSSQNPNYKNDSIWVLTGDVNTYWSAYLDGGCKDTAKVLITYPSLHALRPDTTVNIFTPNGDNRNDKFYPFYSKGFTQHEIDKQMEFFEMDIYDRWGRAVFNTNEYAKPWDGKDQNGKEMDEGTYYYVLKYQSNCSSKADVVSKRGFVQLLR